MNSIIATVVITTAILFGGPSTQTDTVAVSVETSTVSVSGSGGVLSKS